jgi:hypothetical protein
MIFFSGIAAVSLISGILLAKRFQDESLENRGYLVLASCLLGLTLIMAISFTVQGAFFSLSAAKLTPTFALANGYSVFYSADAGPILNTIYGPLAYLVYYPATFAASPTVAMLIANSITASLFLVPLALYLLYANRENTGARSVLFAGLGFAFIVAAAYSTFTTRIIASQIHNNGPAAGVALLSCVVLARIKTPGTLPLFAAALLAASAVWIKQTEVSLVLAQGLFVYLHWGRAVLIRYWLLCLAAASGLGIIFIAAFGFEPMWFNMFYIPGHHSLRIDLTSIQRSLTVLLSDSAVPILIVAIAAATAKLRTGTSIKYWIKTEAWVLPALVAIIIYPTGMLGQLKIGGISTNLHSEYFFLAAAGAALVQFAHTSSNAKWGEIHLRVLVVLALAASAIALPNMLRPQEVEKLVQGHNPVQEASDYARQHPGEVYFPWLPIASLMAEGKLYHFDFGITDRTRAGITTELAHYQEHLPPSMKYLAIQKYGGLKKPTFDQPPRSFSYIKYPEATGTLTPVELVGLENFKVWSTAAD